MRIEEVKFDEDGIHLIYEEVGCITLEWGDPNEGKIKAMAGTFPDGFNVTQEMWNALQASARRADREGLVDRGVRVIRDDTAGQRFVAWCRKALRRQ